MKYRKKPVVIEAVQLNEYLSNENPQWLIEAIISKKISIICESNITPLKIKEAQIYTLEGIMTASLGDYIIKGVNGELYPCKPDIFEKTYEKVEE